MSLNVRSQVSVYGPSVEYINADFTDTNHARGYVVNPTADKSPVVAMSDEAFDGLAFGSMWGECQSGPFVKDAR